MTKVMLINPPQRYFKGSASFSVYIPLGLLSVAAAVKGICNLKVLDCLVTDFEIKKTANFILYGTPFENIAAAIKDYRPDIVGISIPFTAQSENAILVSKICKKIDEDIKDDVYYKPRRFIEDLDELPPPAYDLIDLKDYSSNEYLYLTRSPIYRNSISMITSRGYP